MLEHPEVSKISMNWPSAGRDRPGLAHAARRHLIPGTRHRQPGTRNRQPGTRHRPPSTSRRLPGTRNRQPGTSGPSQCTTSRYT